MNITPDTPEQLYVDDGGYLIATTSVVYKSLHIKFNELIKHYNYGQQFPLYVAGGIISCIIAIMSIIATDGAPNSVWAMLGIFSIAPTIFCLLQSMNLHVDRKYLPYVDTKQVAIKNWKGSVVWQFKSKKDMETTLIKIHKDGIKLIGAKDKRLKTLHKLVWGL